MIKDKEFFKRILKIMIPVALQQAINQGVNMMDTVMVGSLGELQLSGSSLANSFYNLFVILCLGIIGGSSVLAAQYWGAGNKKKVRETFSLAVLIISVVSVIFGVLTFIIPEKIMRLYSSENEVIGYGAKYLKIIAFTYFIHGTSMVASSLMRAVHKAKLGLYVSIISFVVNVFSNWVFIYGKLGMPAMGIAGAALGTLVARCVEFAVTFIYIFAVDSSLGLKFAHIVKGPSMDIWRNYIRMGAAALGSDGLLGVGNNIMTMVIGHMGSVVVSANAVCLVADRLFTVVIAGVSNAASIITGETIGRGEKELAKKQGKMFFRLSILFGLGCGLLIYIFGELTIGLYNLNDETVQMTETLMVAYSFIAVFQSIQSVITKGVLRGGGDTAFLLVADVLFMWLVSIPLGYFLGIVVIAPAWTAIIALRIDYIIKSLWCFRRLNTDKWIHETKTFRLS